MVATPKAEAKPIHVAFRHVVRACGRKDEIIPTSLLYSTCVHQSLEDALEAEVKMVCHVSQ